MENKIKLQDKTFRVLISAEEIDKAVTRVADQLNERYQGRTPIFLGVLSGSFLFLADLVRKVNFESQLAFVKISSYDGTPQKISALWFADISPPPIKKSAVSLFPPTRTTSAKR